MSKGELDLACQLCNGASEWSDDDIQLRLKNRTKVGWFRKDGFRGTKKDFLESLSCCCRTEGGTRTLTSCDTRT